MDERELEAAKRSNALQALYDALIEYDRYYANEWSKALFDIVEGQLDRAYASQESIFDAVKRS